jgi:hypothetical protein
MLRMVPQTVTPALTTEPVRTHPTRWVSARRRNERIAAPLKVLARVRRTDEELVDLLGRRMFARDEVGARLVAAMRRDRDDPERVTMAQLHRALGEGVDAVPDAPAALREFFAVVDEVPEWVDWALLERGARAFRRLGPSRDDVLLQLSLIGGYRFVGPADLLVLTGGLTGSTAQRRLGETQQWVTALESPGGMRRDGEGFRLTVHVRAMHALINQRFETNGRWDVERYGLPVNQSDQAATLGLFNSTTLLGVRALGRIVTRDESLAIMHLWKYVGWLMGVDEDLLFDTEREQNTFNYHVLLAQGGPTPAGAALAGPLVEAKRTQYESISSGRFAGLRGRYSRLRTLSMLRFFLRKEGLRDLGLPVTPIWAVPPIVVANFVASGLLGRTRRGRRWLERSSDRASSRESRLRFGGAPAEIGALPAA